MHAVSLRRARIAPSVTLVTRKSKGVLCGRVVQAWWRLASTMVSQIAETRK